MVGLDASDGKRRRLRRAEKWNQGRRVLQGVMMSWLGVVGGARRPEWGKKLGGSIRVGEG